MTVHKIDKYRSRRARNIRLPMTNVSNYDTCKVTNGVIMKDKGLPEPIDEASDEISLDECEWVYVRTANTIVEIPPGGSQEFHYFQQQWICSEYVYGYLQSVIMKVLYANRKEKKDAGKDCSYENNLLDKVWRCKTSRRSYLGLKAEAPPVRGLEKVERKFVWF